MWQIDPKQLRTLESLTECGQAAGVEGALRLSDLGEGDIDNDPEAGVGILEVFHAGAWGTVCSDDPTLLFQLDADPNLPQVWQQLSSPVLRLA